MYIVLFLMILTKKFFFFEKEWNSNTIPMPFVHNKGNVYTALLKDHISQVHMSANNY